MNKKIISISLYFIFSVALFEGSARLAFYVPKISKRLREYDALSWRREWIDRHKKTNLEVYYKFDIYDATKGWISRPNIRDARIFLKNILNTNSKGFRGAKDYFYTKDPNKVRILILGDSFTFGEHVNDADTYSYHLQTMLPQAEIINMGVHGYGHDQMLILLKEEGIKYNPDIIILGFLPMDMPRNLLNFRDFAKPRFILEDNKLRLTNTPVPRPEEVMKWDWARPRVIDIASIISFRLKESSGRSYKEKKDITTAILTEIIKLAESIEAISIFAYLPSEKEIFKRNHLTLGEKYLIEMCQKNGKARYFSVRPHFAKKVSEGVIFKKKGHWGPAGHLAVAEAMKYYLYENGHVD